MHLPTIELALYFFIYFSFSIYGCYHLYSVRSGAMAYAFYDFHITNDKILAYSYYEFQPGWSIIGQPYDGTAIEFECFKTFMYRNFIWYLLHLLTTESIKCFNSKYVPVVHFLLGIAFVTQTFRTQYLLMIFLLYISFYIIRNIQSKLLSWILALLWIILINTIKQKYPYLVNPNEFLETYQIILLLSWNVLRGLSFILDRHKELATNISAKKWSTLDLMKYSGYMFYFPTFIFGPFIIYDRYSQLFKKDFREKDVTERVATFFISLLRTGFWIFFVNVSLHYFYIFYLEYNHEPVRLLSFLGLYGFGYLMGLYFHIQYVITYGMGINFLRYDGIDPPRQPICIARVHLYSRMWRYFDEGLYEFLFKYIFLELQTKSSNGLRKFFASFITFVFIYIWHGLTMSVLIWSALNFLCLLIEKFFKIFWKSKYFQSNILTHLSIYNQKRLYGLIGCHLFIPSVMSNFYFFAGTRTGNYFVKTTYTSGFGHYLMLTTVCYCIFQASEWVFQITESKKPKNTKKETSLF